MTTSYDSLSAPSNSTSGDIITKQQQQQQQIPPADVESDNLLHPTVNDRASRASGGRSPGRKRTILLLISLIVIVYLLFLLSNPTNGKNNNSSPPGTALDEGNGEPPRGKVKEEDSTQTPNTISTKYAHETKEQIQLYYNARCFVNVYGFHHTHEEVLFDRVRDLLPDPSKVTTFTSPQMEGMSLQNVLPAPLSHGKGKRMPECGGGKSRAVNQYACPNFFRSPSNQKYASVEQERYELMKQWKGNWDDPDRLIMVQRSAWFSVYNLNYLLAPHSLNVISMQHPLTWKRVSVGCGDIDHFVSGHTDLPPVPPLVCAVDWLQVWSHTLATLTASREVIKNFLIVRYESILLDEDETNAEMGAWLKGFAATSPGGVVLVDSSSNVTTTTIPSCSVLDNRAGKKSSESVVKSPSPGEADDARRDDGRIRRALSRDRRRLDNVITPKNVDPQAPSIPLTTAARMNWRHCLWDKACKRCMHILHEGVIGLGYSLIDEMRPVLTSGVFRVLAHDDPQVDTFIANNRRAMLKALNQFRNDGECFRLLGLDFE